MACSRSILRKLSFAAALLLCILTVPVVSAQRRQIASQQIIPVCGSTIDLEIASGKMDATPAQITAWVRMSAESVATYFGRFPVPEDKVLVLPDSGEDGVSSGTTWGSPFVHTRISVGEHATVRDLNEDWMMTHEFVHTAMPQLDDDHHWLEEGLAVYVEPVARVQHGVWPAERAWADMMRDMPQGEPRRGDRGLDHTHSWASTYWGGALFYLYADVTIRQRTGNRKGLQDALQAIVQSGHDIRQDGNPEEVFAIGDRATGVAVLVPMYQQVRDAPVSQDLTALWKSLGVEDAGNGHVRLNDKAPLADIRKAIMQPHAMCSAK